MTKGAVSQEYRETPCCSFPFSSLAPSFSQRHRKCEAQVDTKASDFYPEDQEKKGRGWEVKSVRETMERGGAPESDPSKLNMNF